MVGQRTLTPLILVRIQVKQPIKRPPFEGVFFIGELPKDENQFGIEMSARGMGGRWDHWGLKSRDNPGEAANKKTTLKGWSFYWCRQRDCPRQCKSIARSSSFISRSFTGVLRPPFVRRRLPFSGVRAVFLIKTIKKTSTREVFFYGADRETRTPDPLITNQ